MINGKLKTHYANKLYHEKKKSYLKLSTINSYCQVERIQYAIAYVLCEYFDFKCDNPFSYKWYITYDYKYCYDACKKAYEDFVKENKNTKYNYTAWSTDDFKGIYSKGDTIYNMKDGCFYYYDGKNLIEMG